MDTSILLTTNALLSTAASIVMFVVLLTRKTYRGFGFWVAGILGLALGAAMLVPDMLPSTWLVRVLRNVLLVGGLALVLHGMLLFRNYRIPYGLEVLVALSFLVAFGYYSINPADLSARIVLYCLYASALSLATVAAALRKRPPHFGSNDVLLVLWLSLYAVFSLLRGLQQLAVPGVDTAFEALKGFGAFYAMVQILTVQLVTLTLISINSQRIEWEYRASEESLSDAVEQMRSIGDNMPNGFVFRCTASDGGPRFDYLSAGIVNTLGLQPSEVMDDAQRLLARASDGSFARYLAGPAASVSDTSAHSAILAFERADGQRCWLQIQSSSHRNAAHALVWDGAAIDVSERKRAELALEQYNVRLEGLVAERTEALSRALAQQAHDRERLEYALDATNDGLWDKDFERNVTYLNQAYGRMLGYGADELPQGADDHLMTLLHPEERESIPAQIRQAFATEGAYELEFRMRCKDGHYKWVLSRGKVVARDPQGKPLRAVGTHIDLTTRKELEMSLREAKEGAEAANRAKSAFLANMSHEIRTPLNGLLGMASLLRRTRVTGQQLAFLDKMETSGRHLLTLLNDVLDLSKIDAGKMVLEDHIFDISSVIRTAARVIEHGTTVKRLQFSVDDGDLPQRVFGDATRLTQILVNYLSNALKFTEQGSIRLARQIVAEDDDTYRLRFEVGDTGIGMTRDECSRVFRAFEQADNSTTRKFGGTGLGLAITKKIAELMGGEVGVSSTPGEGSTFWLEIRMRKAGATPAESGAVMASYDAMRGGRVLLVEDEPINQEVAQTYLQDAGFAVDLAHNGAEAVAMAGQCAYDAILMDMQMPVMDGISATQAIRASAGGQDVPILAMTANAFAQDRQKCLDAGMNDFIAKPMESDVLYTTLLRWLGMRRAGQPAD